MMMIIIIFPKSRPRMNKKINNNNLIHQLLDGNKIKLSMLAEAKRKVGTSISRFHSVVSSRFILNSLSILGFLQAS